MACVCSPIDQIDNLHIDSLPAGKPVAAEKVIRIDDLILIVGKNGALYAHGRRFNGRWSYTFGQWPWTNSLMRALAKAKIITAAVAKQHCDLAAARDAERNAKHLAERLECVAADAGITLTAKQKAKIAAMKGE